MKRALTYDDVLLVPQWSDIHSRKDVDLSTKFWYGEHTLPVVSANMDSVTGVEMCNAMAKTGGVGCLHRFWSIESNVNAFMKVGHDTGTAPWCSFGLGNDEFERAEALIEAGCKVLVLDVAHGSQRQVADQYAWVKKYADSINKDIILVAGNFGSAKSVVQFAKYLDSEYGLLLQGVKLGVGPGSICETRVKTGHG